MSGLEIRIPYVSYKTRTKGFPYRINVQPTEMSVQKNLQYYSNKVKLQTNLQPLNTNKNDIEWSIVEGDNYCSINASTGELTIDSSAITQMVKVRAKSVSNPSLIEEREIVLTHREQPIIEDLNLDINISGLQASYNFIDTETTYTFTASLTPSISGYNVVFDVIEGNDCFNITDINWENNQTTVTFAFNEPNEEDTVITLRFCVDKMKEFTKDVSFNVKTLVSDIIFVNIPEAPYIPYELYSFDFSTEPIIKFRNLDVSVISGEQYLDNWYTGNVVGTSGKFYFKRNSVEIPHYEQITVRFADPLDNTIHEDVSLTFENINHVIDISGNKSSYEYNSDKTYYESFIWTETPNYNRELEVIVTQHPDNIIDYYTSDVSGGNGKFNFQTKSVSDEGWVNVRIQDPVTTSGKNATFTIQNEKVARFTSVTGLRGDLLFNDNNDTSWQRLINVISYGNNLQEAQNYDTYGNKIGYYYFIYDTSDNNFNNEYYSNEYSGFPRRHYTGVNLYDTSLYIEFDYIPGNSLNQHYYYPGGLTVNSPVVQYELDSSRLLYYQKTVDISTNLPKGTYYTKTKEFRNSSTDDLTQETFEIRGQRKILILDSSHYGEYYIEGYDYNTNSGRKQIFDPIAVYTDIPHIGSVGDGGDITYLDPSANIISTYFNNIEGNKEIPITYVRRLRYVNQRPVDTDEYFYVFSDWDNIAQQEMAYIMYYSPMIIDYIRNYLHLNGNIAKILFNDTYTGKTFMDSGDLADMKNNMHPLSDSSIFSPYVLPIYKLEDDYDYNVNKFKYGFDVNGDYTGGIVYPIPAGTYDIAINYKADIVPIDYTINVKVNVK